uniref:ADAM metallopeptidase domain 18 n=1 Tax=Saimiri boliviensis boliviensis TaxID=39432 RepID=A0A2K6T353_SAIBB
MFLLLTLLTEFGRLQAHLGSEGIFLHVTVPRKMMSNESEVSESKIIYIITIDGQPYTLHLRKNSFLPQNFLVFTYSETGSLHAESAYFMMHCHYQGYAAEFPNSFVTLSICSGLRGFLQFENISYGIEPLEFSARFEHIIYQMKNNDPNVSSVAENYSLIWQKDQTYKVHLNSQKNNLPKLLTQYLEIHIIVEKALMFTQFKLTVILSSLELWSNENQISTSGDADDILQRFLAWKRDYLILRPHDVAYLLVYRKHPKYVGATFPGTICNKSYDAGIVMYPDAIGLEGFSVIIAQLLGLNVGLTYDDVTQCSCMRATCIMNREAECQFKKCCDYNTCKLKGSVKCGSGPCCTSKCELSIAGTPCRKSIDPECDFTEYCNGTSSNCVPDTYALNGHLCRLGTAYCYNGQCQTTDNQCAKIFGKGAQGAPLACFKEVNYLNERSENCGFKNSQPLPCEQKYSVSLKINVVFVCKIYVTLEDELCYSAFKILSSILSSSYCVNKTCRKARLMGYNCNATTKCKGKGNEWYLVFCSCVCWPRIMIGSPGGSIDDGKFQKSDEFYTEKSYNKQWNNWFILSFYIFLPFFMIFIIVIFKRNEIRKLSNRENTEYKR